MSLPTAPPLLFDFLPDRPVVIKTSTPASAPMPGFFRSGNSTKVSALPSNSPPPSTIRAISGLSILRPSKCSAPVSTASLPGTKIRTTMTPCARKLSSSSSPAACPRPGPGQSAHPVPLRERHHHRFAEAAARCLDGFKKNPAGHGPLPHDPSHDAAVMNRPLLDDRHDVARPDSRFHGARALEAEGHPQPFGDRFSLDAKARRSETRCSGQRRQT
jgi:hypothetical protein